MAILGTLVDHFRRCRWCSHTRLCCFYSPREPFLLLVISAFFILFPVVLSASVMGDSLGYLLGRRLGAVLLAWLERRKRFRWITLPALAQSQTYFRKRRRMGNLA